MSPGGCNPPVRLGLWRFNSVSTQFPERYERNKLARVMELVDIAVLEIVALVHAGSSPVSGIFNQNDDLFMNSNLNSYDSPCDAIG